MRPDFKRGDGTKIILPDTGLSLIVGNLIAQTKMDCVYDELRILDEMAIAWWLSKYFHSIEDRPVKLDHAVHEDIRSLQIQISSQFDGLDDEEMDRDMEFYEQNNLAHRMSDLCQEMSNIAPLINQTFNVALLSGVNLDDARLVGIEKTGVFPVMFID